MAGLVPLPEHAARESTLAPLPAPRAAAQAAHRRGVSEGGAPPQVSLRDLLAENKKKARLSVPPGGNLMLSGGGGSSARRDSFLSGGSGRSERTDSVRVVNTPFTSTRYSRRINSRLTLDRTASIRRMGRTGTGSNATTSMVSGLNSVASRLREVKRLVAAGIVKPEVYDKLVGANADGDSIGGNRLRTPTLGAVLNSKRKMSVVTSRPSSKSDASSLSSPLITPKISQEDVAAPAKITVTPLPEHRRVQTEIPTTTVAIAPPAAAEHRRERSAPEATKRVTFSEGIRRLLPSRSKPPTSPPRSPAKSDDGADSSMQSPSEAGAQIDYSTASSPLDMPEVAQGVSSTFSCVLFRRVSRSPALTHSSLRILNQMLFYKVEIMGVEKAADYNGAVFNTFVISVNYNDMAEIDETWVIRRRYRVFNGLNKAVRKELARFPALIKALPRFPAKHGMLSSARMMLTNTSKVEDGAFLEKRRVALEHYIEGLVCLCTRNSQTARMLQTFLHAPDTDYTVGGQDLNFDGDKTTSDDGGGSGGGGDSSSSSRKLQKRHRSRRSIMRLSAQHKKEPQGKAAHTVLGVGGPIDPNSFRASIGSDSVLDGVEIDYSGNGRRRKLRRQTSQNRTLSNSSTSLRQSRPRSATAGDLASKHSSTQSFIELGVDAPVAPAASAGSDSPPAPASASASSSPASPSADGVSPTSLEQQRADGPSPTPELPPRPLSTKFSSENKNGQLDRSNSSRMIVDATTAATQSVHQLKKRKSDLDPPRKLVKGKDGYRYEWRRDLAPCQNYMWKRGGWRGGNKVGFHGG